MFSNTAYEALYQYLGLALHGRFIEIITSQKVFLSVLLMTFGTVFFLTTVQFFSRYLPGSVVHRRPVPLSRYFKIIACLFLGSALLRVGTSSEVRKFNGESWHSNPYVKSQLSEVLPEYHVSFVFDLLSRSAEEIAALIARSVDSLFKSQNSQLDAPNFFFKAIMYAGSSTIDNAALRSMIHFYADECFDRVLPLAKKKTDQSWLDSLWGNDATLDADLAALKIDNPQNLLGMNCLDVKNDIVRKMQGYAEDKGLGAGGKAFDDAFRGLPVPAGEHSQLYKNLEMSSYLVNFYNDGREGAMGIEKDAQLPGSRGRVFQYINRLFSWDGILSLGKWFGTKDLMGASLAASRSQEFSDMLARAPHVAGFIKMMIIALFPWLIFFIVAGYWRVLAYWWAIYFSVLLWTPIWTLLYHIVVKLSLSADMMMAFGKLSDGISLYSAELVTSRMYHLYAVYSWLQILLGTLFTGSILYFMRPMLSDTKADSAPEFVDSSANVAAKGSRVAGIL